jgi:membrane-bound acyltransferase YfiQ involved in biofilm formation
VRYVVLCKWEIIKNIEMVYIYACKDDACIFSKFSVSYSYSSALYVRIDSDKNVNSCMVMSILSAYKFLLGQYQACACSPLNDGKTLLALNEFEVKKVVTEKKIRRPYIYELDLFRSLTMLTVILVHVLAATAYLYPTLFDNQVQNAFIDALHSNRFVFMYVSAFALVYVYHGKPFSAINFWKKRSLGILVPYIIWSMLYVAVANFWTISLRHYLKLSFIDILNGEASFQLYFILITIQFYILFPFFIAFMNRVKNHPWTVLGISFLIQVVWLYWDYRTIQMGRINLVGFWHYYEHYRESIIFSYQFYFVLGGMSAMYFTQIRAFLLRHYKLVISVALVSLIVFIGHYFLQVITYHEAIPHANAVTQPMMAFYATAVIFFVLWISCRWALNAGKEHLPRAYKYIHTLSNASFGVYLMHAFVLTIMTLWLIPALPATWPAIIRVIIGYIFTAGISVTFCLLLLRVPVLCRLIGREYVPSRKASPTSDLQVPPAGSDTPEPKVEQIVQISH